MGFQYFNEKIIFLFSCYVSFKDSKAFEAKTLELSSATDFGFLPLKNAVEIL